jgi:hypothetical protein
MDATTPGVSAVPGQFGAGRLFLADSRMAFAIFNHVRVLALQRVFGVARPQANLLTAVLALAAADAAYESARRLAHAPFGLSGADAAMGGFALREAAMSVAGPGVRDAPLVGTLVAIAVLGSVGLPGVRRAVGRARAAEHRVRQSRISRYTTTAA